MDEIEGVENFGEGRKKYQFIRPQGAGGHFQILIDKYYQGTIEKRNGKWVAHLNRTSKLTPDDIWIIGELLDNARLPDII